MFYTGCLQSGMALTAHLYSDKWHSKSSIAAHGQRLVLDNRSLDIDFFFPSNSNMVQRTFPESYGEKISQSQDFKSHMCFSSH